jgi:hypothetical protein
MGCELAQGYGLCRPLPPDRCGETLLGRFARAEEPAAPPGPARLTMAAGR